MYHWPIRKKLRYENYNYSCDRYYFVTICTEKRKNYFWKIENGKMILNAYGRITKQIWLKIPQHYPKTIIDEFIIMPNHIHGIIIIDNSMSVENENFRSLHNTNLSNIIKWFKIGCTKQIHQSFPHSTFAWQKSFYDTILRNEQQLINTREYTANNPNWWEKDEYFC